jgi:hypothetical protein
MTICPHCGGDTIRDCPDRGCRDRHPLTPSEHEQFRRIASMTVKEIAAKIDAHLRRFEADPEVNRYGPDAPVAQQKLKRFWNAHAWDNGRYVRVLYISYQGSTALPKADAERYLAKLDAGFVGRHFEALRGGECDPACDPSRIRLTREAS